MPNPKRRHSRTRGRKRRTGDALATPALSRCPNCQEVRLPHRVCAHCGYYAGREVVAAKEKT